LIRALDSVPVIKPLVVRFLLIPTPERESGHELRGSFPEPDWKIVASASPLTTHSRIFHLPGMKELVRNSVLKINARLVA
jgi:hypothetical protein